MSVLADLWRERFVRTDLDSVAFDASLTGAYRWTLGMDSDEPAFPIIVAPQTSVTTPYDESWFYFEPTPDSITPGPPYQYSWASFDDIPAGGYGADTYIESALPVTFSPGFDSERIISPLLLSSGQVTQTVTVHVTPQEEYQRILVTISADTTDLTRGTLVPASPALTPVPVGGCDFGTGAEYVSWNCPGGEVGTTYTFQAEFVVNNNVYPIIVEHKPRVVVRGQRNDYENGISLGSSLTVTDDVLGTVTYSATGEYSWNYFARDRWAVIYRPLALPLPAVDDPAGDVTLAGHAPAPASLYASYLDIRHAEVTLNAMDGNYVFTMRLEGAAAPDLLKEPVKYVRYVWRIYDSDGNVILRVYIDWSESGEWVAGFDGTAIAWTRLDSHTLQVTLPISAVPGNAVSWDARAWNSRNLMKSAPTALGPPTFLSDMTASASFPTLV